VCEAIFRQFVYFPLSRERMESPTPNHVRALAPPELYLWEETSREVLACYQNNKKENLLFCVAVRDTAVITIAKKLMCVCLPSCISENYYVDVAAQQFRYLHDRFLDEKDLRTYNITIHDESLALRWVGPDYHPMHRPIKKPVYDFKLKKNTKTVRFNNRKKSEVWTFKLHASEDHVLEELSLTNCLFSESNKKKVQVETKLLVLENTLLAYPLDMHIETCIVRGGDTANIRTLFLPHCGRVEMHLEEHDFDSFASEASYELFLDDLNGFADVSLYLNFENKHTESMQSLAAERYKNIKIYVAQ